jgi:hypothetical protein
VQPRGLLLLDPEGVPLPVPYVCLEHSDVEYAAGFEDPLYTSAKLGKEELGTAKA